MADEAMMISAIEKLDSWLLKEADRRYQDCKKLLSLQFESKDLLIEMAKFWEKSKEKLYTLLVKVADPSLEEEGMVSKEKMHDFLVEMADLWEDDEGSKLKPLDIKKLHNLMLKMAKPHIYDRKLYSLAVQMADLWKERKGKLNKEKICSWLTNKAGLEKNYKVIHLLEGMTDPWPWGCELKKKIKLPEEILKNVEGAKEDLRSILDLLSNAGEVEEGSRLHYFVSDAVEMAHDACLLVQLKDSDPFVLFLAIFNCCFVGRAEFRVHPFSDPKTYGNFFKKIVSIHRSLQETKELMLEFGFEREASQNVAEFGGKDDDRVVGLEEDMESLLCKMNSATCIWGMGGIRKTTLARELYNHPAVVHLFERRAWVCLSSRELSRKEILIKVIRQLLVDRHSSKGSQRDDDDDDDKLLEKMDNKSLRQMLHQHLQGRRYFIVLDDVSEDTCLKLKYIFGALPKDRISRLLFTTRNADIHCDDDDYNCQFNYKMKNLDDDKSWKLLLKTAFCGSSDEEFFPKQLQKKGREMLRKCNGLPLAIKEMGSQWARKRRSGTKWEEVVESSIDLGETLMALESTYLNLNPHVKSCFLSLGFFKEGTTIKADKLVQIWTAGGLEEQESEKCLSKLTQESIIEVKEMTKDIYDDRVKTCRINSIFHKLSITKAEDDELGFEILRKDGNRRPRHRVIHCSRYNFNYSTNQDKHLVSAFFHGGGSHVEECWNHFELLETLDMEGFGLKILPETVGELTGLRYFGLRNNHIQELPHSLARLKELEVLDIAQNFMVQVPDVIWEMDRLRHLYMSDTSCQKPLKIDALKNLKTLAYISVHNWTYEVSGLKLMTSLRRLGIEEVDGNTDVSKLFKSLSKLMKLDCLILRGFRFRSMPSLDKLGLLQNLLELKLEGRLTRLPSASNFPPKIYYLSLVNSCLDEDPMPILEKLSELQNLKLQNAYTGHQMVMSTDGFHQLRKLVIRELWHLRNIVQVGEPAGLWFNANAEINSCPNLETVPQNIFFRLDHLKSQTVKCIVPEGESQYSKAMFDMLVRIWDARYII